MDEELFRHRMNQELESINFNKLTQLGNRAVRLQLIIGHGWRSGKYEILHRDKALLISAQEAQTYLENLIKEIDY